MTTQAKYVAHMGERLGKRFDELWKDLAWLNVKWAQYTELFCSNRGRVDLLNETAPVFFRIVQDTLLEDVLLHVARLTEHSRPKGRNEKLTIHTLPALVDVRIRNRVSYAVKIAQQKAATCLDWRHRHIAHRNVALALKEAKPLEPITLQCVRDALAAIAEVLNEVHKQYVESEIGFGTPGRAGGAVELLYVIKDGLKAAEDREKRLHSGDIRREDWARREI
jgi:hypothetical protein